MNKIIIYVFIFILFFDMVYSEDYITIKSVIIRPNNLLTQSNNDIYPGAFIGYNISLISPENKSLNQTINISIFNPAKEIIESRNYYFNISNNYSFNIGSNLNGNEWKLIYADVPGIYKLVISSNSDLQFYETKANYYRHDTSLPIYFEVKSLEVKEIVDNSNKIAIDNNITNSEMLEIAKKSYDASNNALKLSKIAIIFSIVLFILERFMAYIKEREIRKKVIKALIHEVEKNKEIAIELKEKSEELINDEKVPFNNFVTFNLEKALLGNYIEKSDVRSLLFDYYQSLSMMNNFINRARISSSQGVNDTKKVLDCIDEVNLKEAEKVIQKLNELLH